MATPAIQPDPSQVMVDVFSPPDASNPHGVKGKVPASQLQDFMSNGFQRAVSVTTPEGTGGWLPTSLVGNYLKQGFHLGPPNQQNLEQTAKDAKPGAVSNFAFNALKPFYLGNIEENRTPGQQLAYEAKMLTTKPGATLKATVMTPVNAYTQGVNKEFGRAKDQAAKGDTAGAIAHTAYGMIPIIGPQGGDAAEQLRSGDVSGGLGTMAGIGLQGLAASPETGELAAKPVTALASKTGQFVKQGAQAVRVARNPVAAAETLPAETLAIKATKPRNSINNVQQQMQTALPDVRRAADSMGLNVQTLDDARAATLQAKQDVWNEYSNNHLEPGQQSGAVIDGNKIADAMTSKITRTMELENPAKAQAIRETANLYRKPIPLSEAEQFLQDSNNALNSYYAKTKVSQRVAARDPEVGPEVAKADALRQELNSKLDDITGPGAQQLKQRYGALNTLEDVLNRRINVAERQAPESLIEQMAKKDAAIQTGKGVFKIATGRPLAGGADIYGAVQGLKAAKSSRLANDSNFLISKALEKTQPTPPAVLRAQPQNPLTQLLSGQAKQLPAGQYPMPPSSMQTFADNTVSNLAQPIPKGLPAGQYEAPPSPLQPLFLRRQPQLQPAPTVPPSRQLPAAGLPQQSGSTLQDMLSGRNVETVGMPQSAEEPALRNYLNPPNVIKSKTGAVQASPKSVIQSAGYQQMGQPVGNMVRIIDPQNAQAGPKTMTIQEIQKGGIPAIRRKMQNGTRPAATPKPAQSAMTSLDAFQRAVNDVGGAGKQFEDLTPQQQNRVIDLAQLYKLGRQ